MGDLKPKTKLKKMSLFCNHEYAYIQEKSSAQIHRTRARNHENFYRRFLTGNNMLTKRSKNENMVIEQADSKGKDENEIFYHYFKL